MSSGRALSAEALDYRPASAALRKKIAVLEGVAFEDADNVAEPPLSAGEMAAAAGAPMCAEKVFAAVAGWDDLALAGLLEAALGAPLDRVSVKSEDQLQDPRHVNDDCIAARCVTKDQRSVSVLLKAMLLLLPSAQALTRIVYNTLHRLTEQLWSGGHSAHNYQWSKCVAVTFVRDHSKATFAGYPSELHPWRKVVRWGPDSEPWNLCEFVFVSISEWQQAGSPVDSALGQWCWFLARHEAHTAPGGVPAPVLANPGIRSMWRNCARLAPDENFCRQWGDAAIDTAHGTMIASAEHAARTNRQQEALEAHRIGLGLGAHRALTVEYDTGGQHPLELEGYRSPARHT
eukprot:TRINITY_DN10451_c0_g1_i1.p1 TRINITY_DN10451_c0_g1~~TRINITY_DN10451_c0_g1_i1.p1  ORF type:complete len:375 (+),score=132.97 TRINITY_DN10451_c0_g1_i1:88-1125(+)